MFQVKRIVVGVGLPMERPWNVSTLKLAVQAAFQVASGGRIPVVLAAILQEPSTGWFGSHEDANRRLIQDRDAAAAVLDELKQRYAADSESGRLVDCVVHTGDASEELIRLAGNHPDTLIVCGTHDPRLKLFELAPGPVWIVKPPLEEHDSVGIVACTDLGPVGADVIRMAVSMAVKFSSQVHVVHAADAEGDITELTHKVYEQLAATDYRTVQSGVKVDVSVGVVDQCILNAVREANAGLVILGTSSKTDAPALSPKSTAERLLCELTCSIMALKPEGFRSMLPADFWTAQRTPPQYGMIENSAG